MPHLQCRARVRMTVSETGSTRGGLMPSSVSSGHVAGDILAIAYGTKSLITLCGQRLVVLRQGYLAWPSAEAELLALALATLRPSSYILIMRRFLLGQSRDGA